MTSAFEEALPPTGPSATRPLRPLYAAAGDHDGQSAPGGGGPAGARRRAKATLRAGAVLTLHVEEELSYAEIAAQVGVSSQRVHQIIDAALAEVAGHNRELAECAFDRELLLIEALIREAADVVLRKCEACAGDEERRVLCKTCRKTGFAYPTTKRLVAMDRIGRAQDRRIKLLGLDKRSPPAANPGRRAQYRP